MRQFFTAGIIFLNVWTAFSALKAAQPGGLDPAFQIGESLAGEVRAIAVQRNGRVLIGGDFTSVPGATHRWISRLLPNGRADPTFLVGEGFRHTTLNGYVDALAIFPNGKIAVGGLFDRFNGIPVHNLVLLKPDGTLDTGFAALEGGANGPVHSLVLTGNNSLIVAGDFTTLAGQPRGRIAVMSVTGTLGGGIGTANGFNHRVLCVAIDEGQRIYAVGDFTQYRLTATPGIARLASSGDPDVNFPIAPEVPFVAGPNQTIEVIKITPTGRLAIGGQFTAFSGQGRDRVAILEADGSVAGDFFPPQAIGNTVHDLVVERDGSVIVGGGFEDFEGQGPTSLAKLTPTGALDPNYQVKIGTDDPGSSVKALVKDRTGRLLVGGSFSRFEGRMASSLVRLQRNGRLDRSLTMIKGIDGTIHCALVQPDGRIVIGGTFNQIDGQPRRGLARLLQNGKLDRSFNPGTGLIGGEAADLAIDSEDRIIVGGSFTAVDGRPFSKLVRLLPNGRVDTFISKSFDGDVKCVAVGSNNEIFIGGDFTVISGLEHRYVARVFSSGLVSAGLGEINKHPNSPVETLVLSPSINGTELILGGNFTQYGGQNRVRLVRVETDGDLVAGFDPGTGPNGLVKHVIYDPDNDSIFICGFFEQVDGQPRSRVAKLNSLTGELDGDFVAPPIQGPFLPTYLRMLFDSTTESPSLVLVGAFTGVGGHTRSGIVRLDTESGEVDELFGLFGALNGIVTTVQRLPSGSFLIGGDFTAVEGYTRVGMARLFDRFRWERLSFRGRVTEGSVNTSLGSSFSLNITRNGRFTATSRGRNRLRFRGKMEDNGMWIGTIQVGNLSSDALLLIFPHFGQQTISVFGSFDGTDHATLFAQQPFAKSRNAPSQTLTGYHTGRMLPPSLHPSEPNGHGLISVRIGRNGIARIAGATADGAGFTASTAMGPSGRMDFYSNLYSRRGSFAGSMNWDNTNPAIVISGVTTWIKQGGASRSNYPLGFGPSTSYTFTTRYNPPVGIMLGLASASENARLRFQFGHLDPSLNGLISINSANRLLPGGSYTGLRLRFNARTGLIFGSIPNPLIDARGRSKFRMMLISGIVDAQGFSMVRHPTIRTLRSSNVLLSSP